MLIKLLAHPFFWIGIYLFGYSITIVVLSLGAMQKKVESRPPKPLVRIFILTTFIAPPLILPFTKGPKMVIPSPFTLTVGILLLIINFFIKIIAQRQIGIAPALKGKGKLISTGIYGIVRHPLYMSNGLLALGMAILFKSTYAFLFSIPYTLLYLPIIHFEEKNLLEKYGEEYKEYKKKVPWRLIPKLF